MNKILLLTCFLCVFGCSTHEDFPEPLDIKVPTAVTNLVVTHPDALLYTLEWSVPDTTGVDHYNVYIVGTYGYAEFLGSTDATIVDVTVPVVLSSVVFGVSVVTDENVEGRLVYAVAPD